MPARDNCCGPGVSPSFGQKRTFTLAKFGFYPVTGWLHRHPTRFGETPGLLISATCKGRPGSNSMSYTISICDLRRIRGFSGSPRARKRLTARSCASRDTSLISSFSMSLSSFTTCERSERIRRITYRIGLSGIESIGDSKCENFSHAPQPVERRKAN